MGMFSMRIGVVMVSVVMCLFVIMVMLVVMGMMMTMDMGIAMRITNQPARASAEIITQRAVLNIASGS